MIKCFYWKPTNNFGDMLSPIILEYVSKEKVIYAEREEEGKVLAVGSVFNALRRNDKVWTSGIIRNKEFFVPEGVKILAVRGPLTHQLIKNYDVPEIYGDGSILIPEIYFPKVKKEYDFGILSHEVDKKLFFKKEKNCLNININDDVYKIIDQINMCNIIVTSSLHGIIVSEMYRIPTIWVKVTNKIIGGDHKFNDYFLSTGRDTKEPLNWERIKSKLFKLSPIELPKIELIIQMREDIKDIWE